MTKTQDRKNLIRDLFDQLAPKRKKWIKKNAEFHQNDISYMRFIIPPNQKILDIGCGNGHLLNALEPSRGIGIDFSSKMIEAAKNEFPELEFCVGDTEDPDLMNTLHGPFDFIVLSDTIGMLEDIEASLNNLKKLCTPETRIVIAYYSQMWGPLLKLGELLSAKMPQAEQNWLNISDIESLLNLGGFDVIRREWRQLIPRRWFGAGALINRYIGSLPGLRRLSLRNYLVARPTIPPKNLPNSATVLIPCRNEAGNIEPAIQRIPNFCESIEILFVEGHSEDGTFEEINRVINAYPDKDIKVLKQPGRGKGNAVRAGFNIAQGQILMILDADLTVPPETLPNFFRAIASDKGEFINGTRLIYPMENGAMRFLNRIANRLFSKILSWLMGQTVTDTLCGTKVISKKHYQKISENRSYFGDFDPFGDFDLLFGADKLNLKIIEVPIRYAARDYGETQISRFRDGWKLIKMVGFAYRKLKAF